MYTGNRSSPMIQLDPAKRAVVEVETKQMYSK